MDRNKCPVCNKMLTLNQYVTHVCQPPAASAGCKQCNELALILVDAELITRSRCREITGMNHGEIAKLLAISPIWKEGYEAGYTAGCKDTRHEIAQKLNGNVNDGITTAVQRLTEEITAVHKILDSDDSKIIRNAKDGYPEGRPEKELSLMERVASLCVYAADWKRWSLEHESALQSAQKETAREIITIIKQLEVQFKSDAIAAIKSRYGVE